MAAKLADLRHAGIAAAVLAGRGALVIWSRTLFVALIRLCGEGRHVMAMARIDRCGHGPKGAGRMLRMSADTAAPASALVCPVHEDPFR